MNTDDVIATDADGDGAAVQAPRDNELWEMTRSAIAGAGAAVDGYLAGGGWARRINLPTVGAFDSGWPSSSRGLATQQDGPVDYFAFFGPNRGDFTPIAYADVPEMAALLSYVRSREHLVSRVSASWANNLPDFFIDYETALLPISILGRARAVGAIAEDDVLALYLERERAWLMDPLPVEYVIPLALTALDVTETVIIDGDARIELLDGPTQVARAPGVYASVESVPTPVTSAATHALVLSGYDLPNPGPTPRIFGRIQEVIPLAEADLICEALRLVTSGGVGYAQVLRRPLGWADRWEHDLPPLDRVRTLRRYPERFNDYGWLKKPDVISREEVLSLPSIVASLREAAAKVRLATRRLSLATLRDDDDDDQALDACIGLEALLGDGRDELSHRMALRAATALATRAERPLDPQTIYSLMKKVYDHRSAVVHGTAAERSRTVEINGVTLSASFGAVWLLRELLTDVLTRPGGWTPKDLDTRLLAALVEQPDGVPEGTAT